jgi:hypothetical protein
MGGNLATQSNGGIHTEAFSAAEKQIGECSTSRQNAAQEIAQFFRPRLWILYPTGQSSIAYRQAGVAGNTFRLVGSLSRAPEARKIRLANQRPGD